MWADDNKGDIGKVVATERVHDGEYASWIRNDKTLDDFAFAEPWGEVTNPRVTWTSSRKKVATIDAVHKRVALHAGVCREDRDLHDQGQVSAAHRHQIRSGAQESRFACRRLP